MKKNRIQTVACPFMDRVRSMTEYFCVNRLFPCCPLPVPRPMRGVGPYRRLGPGCTREEIRQDILCVQRRRCAACGTYRRPLYGEDVWDYKDDDGIAVLVGFELLCRRCHNVARLDRTAARGKLRAALRWLRRLNQCNAADAEHIRDVMMTQWEERGRKTWVVRVSRYLSDRYPELEALRGLEPPI